MASALPIAMGVLGAFGARKDAKAAQKQAAKGSDFNETTKRTPYGPSEPRIEDIIRRAGELSNMGPQGPMPYAWQNFLNNPVGPGAGADPTYGGSPPGGGSAPALTWKGKDKAEVQAAKLDRQNARAEARKAPTASSAPQGGEMSGAQGAAPQGPQFRPQGGPFGYSQGIRDYMMQNYQQGGVGGYQPAMQYIQSLLGGQSTNPFLSQSFERVSNYKNPYFQDFLPKG